jgi:hypothetical protein
MGMIAFFSRLAGMPTIVPDVGYDSPQELAALKDLDAINKEAGTLAGDSVVRLVGGDDPYILGWIDPHSLDPVAVRLFSDGRAEWMYADDPDNIPAWQPHVTGDTSLSARMLSVLQAHSGDLFGTLQPDASVGGSEHNAA